MFKSKVSVEDGTWTIKQSTKLKTMEIKFKVSSLRMLSFVKAHISIRSCLVYCIFRMFINLVCFEFDNPARA